MGFRVFIVILIVTFAIGIIANIFSNYRKSIADAQWRERMHQKSIDDAQYRFIQEKKKLMEDELNEAVIISNQLKKEADYILFEQKCLKSAYDITVNCKDFCELELEKINGVEFYTQKWKNEYDCLIENISDEKLINLHEEIKEFSIEAVQDFIISGLKESNFEQEMIGKALDIDVIYGKLCVLSGARSTSKYNKLLKNLGELLDAIFSKGLIFIKQLEYGKFENPLDDLNEMKQFQQHEKEIKQEIKESLSHVTDNENGDFDGMLRVFNLEFFKKMAMLMWYYAKKKPFNSDEFYEACGYFDIFTASVHPVSERIIAEVYAKNQIGGLELVRQDIDKINGAILGGKTVLYQKYIVSALAWMELYDLEINVLKNIVNAKGTITESMQERLSFLSDGGATNIKVYDIEPVSDFLYFDSSSCEWTAKEFDIFFKKISMKNTRLKYSLSINTWRKTIPLVSGQKISNSLIYNEFIKMTDDFDGEVKCRKIKAKAVNLENLIYDEAVLFEFNSERNRCMSILFSCEKFGRNLNLVITTMFTPENDLIPAEMKKYALAIHTNIYVESFRESILQAIDESLKEKKTVYEVETGLYRKIFE